MCCFFCGRKFSICDSNLKFIKDIGSAVLEDSDATGTEDTGLKKTDDNADDNGGGDAVDTEDVVGINTISEVSANVRLW